MTKAKDSTTGAKNQPITMENYSPVYGLFGDDPLARDRFLGKLRELFTGSDPSGLNHEKFDAQESPADVVLSAAQSLPMFSTARFVEVRNTDALNAALLEPYLAYLADPNPTTCLVFMGESVDKKKKFFKLLEERGYLHLFARGNRTQMMATIRVELETAGLKFDPDVPALLVDLLGTQDLSLALEKLKLLKAADLKSRLTIDEVFSAVGDGGEGAVFTFIDDVFSRDVQRAFEQLMRLKEDRQQSPIAIIGLLARQLRALVFLKSNETPPGIPPFLLGKLGGLARGFTWKQLFEWHSALRDADRRCKSSRAEPWLVFEALLLSFFVTKPQK
ncbi:DNA polymerase III subunit delta [Myxococcota bacterium]|nr:DNA polymerase III subunit delta [Myxococcota bacterium]